MDLFDAVDKSPYRMAHIVYSSGEEWVRYPDGRVEGYKGKKVWRIRPDEIQGLTTWQPCQVVKKKPGRKSSP